jgi:hypothetical protein
MARNFDFELAPEGLADVEGIAFSYTKTDKGDSNE